MERQNFTNNHKKALVRMLNAIANAFSRPREGVHQSGADISLDEPAKSVGIGIWNRVPDFPMRDALLEAVYRTEAERLAAAEADFSSRMPP
ncbi:hypothetical protein [Tunturiibacter lichenicola]|uniref:hypothetical protein n=1 Tax=Tunturiibacter lichenicola TaxID=2051959 RepID=UPI003D9BBBB5